MTTVNRGTGKIQLLLQHKLLQQQPVIQSQSGVGLQSTDTGKNTASITTQTSTTTACNTESKWCRTTVNRHR